MKRLLENLLEQDIFKPPTEEELEQAKIEVFIKMHDGRRNPDGSYDFDEDLYAIELGNVIVNGRFIIKFGKVGGDFVCSECELTTLEGAPEYVGRYFGCSYNELTSLKGAPERVGGDFDCSHNDLTSLEGAPKYVGGNFVCFDNPVKFTKEDVSKVSEVKGWKFV